MFSIILKLLALTPASQSAHPLIQISEIIEKDLHLYVAEGQILIESPNSSSVYYPFRDPSQQFAPKPSDFEGWTLIDTKCVEDQKPVQIQYTDISGTYSAEAMLHEAGLRVYWKQKEVILAEQMIMQQATPCAIHVREADANPGLELIVAWQFNSNLSGFTIFKIPETAYSTVKTTE